MSRMSNSEYQDAKHYIQDRFQYGSGDKQEYIRYICGIRDRYDDGLDCAQQLDHYQTKWNVNEYIR